MSRLGPRLAAVALAAGLAAGLGAPGAAAQTVPPQPGGSGCLPPPPTVDPAIPWAQQQLGFQQQVWPLTRGSGVTVAVVDTGVAGDSPQLRGGRVLPGVDIASGAPANSDCYGHGTFVAGIIAAAPQVGVGFTGVAPDSRILPIRVTVPADNNPAGTLTAAALATGIRTAVDRGAKVINVSASTSAPDPGLAAAVAYAAARDVVVVASAANGARTGDPVTYPASYPSVIAVGAVDAKGAHADFSQTGPYLSLVAPGVDVVSIGPGGPGQWQGSGTSYAAPFVAGTAALVRAYRPGLDAAKVKHRLETTASHPAAKLPDPALGWGTVNPTAAVSAVLPEEGARAAALVGPPPMSVAPPLPDTGPGALVATIAGLGAIVGAGALLLVSRLGSAGRRRGWAPARVVTVVSSEDEPAEPTGRPAARM